MRVAGGRAEGAATGNRRGKAAHRWGARRTTISLSVRSKAPRREGPFDAVSLNVHAPLRGALNARDCSGGSTSGAASGYLQSPLPGWPRVSDSRRVVVPFSAVSSRNLLTCPLEGPSVCFGQQCKRLHLDLNGDAGHKRIDHETYSKVGMVSGGAEVAFTGGLPADFGEGRERTRVLS
jgi:hypothetical protein